uniref:Odorant receptor n=1 Tax=Campoletis chlorideae TaxID=219166 RepID=A0A346D446_9HYME|nr:odorant receptor [Campoletis chlorideae]
MDFFHGPNYRISKYFLSVLGLWPLQKPKEKYFFRCLTISMFSSIVLPKLIRFAEYYGDFSSMIECFPVLALHGVGCIKFSNYCINAKRLRELTCWIEEDWKARSAQNDVMILARYANRGRIFVMAYGVYLYATLSIYLLLPAIPILLDVIAPLNQSRQVVYLYETEYFVDPDEYYFYILAHAYVTMPFSLCMIVSFDAMLAVYIHHACGIFSTIGSHLEAIGRDNPDEKSHRSANYVEYDHEAYVRIVHCVRMHRRVLEFVRILQSSLSVCLAFVTALCTMIITVTGFMAVSHLDELAEAVRFGSFGVGAILHMFCTCWLGQMLVDHSEQIFSNALQHHVVQSIQSGEKTFHFNYDAKLGVLQNFSW